MRGISMSSSIRSGTRSSRRSSASTPSRATLTSKLWRSRMRPVTLRMVSESSTTITSGTWRSWRGALASTGSVGLARKRRTSGAT
ncbi:hypothetical protein G6F40_017872 [Rhizopus arrhizus]|nr:hypothetical protein G6F40_017872 [Rhizopus arrhizus]